MEVITAGTGELIARLKTEASTAHGVLVCNVTAMEGYYNPEIILEYVQIPLDEGTESDILY